MSSSFKKIVNFPVASFCAACGQPIHQDTQEGWNPATTPARMLCKNPVCSEAGRVFLFTPKASFHPWEDE
jgi:hypothetical protein